MEVPRPGTLRRARLPLEASIHISPTLQLSNGLPYEVLGWALVPPGRDLTTGSSGAQQGSSGTADKAGKAAGGQGAREKWHLGRDDPLTGRPSMTGAPGVAQAAAAAVAAGGAGSTGEQLAGLQQVWQASGRREAALALSRIVATLGPAQQALHQQSTALQHLSTPTANTKAQGGRIRRASWFGAGTAAASETEGATGRSSATGEVGHGSRAHSQLQQADGQFRRAKSSTGAAVAGRQGTDGGAAAAGIVEQQDKVLQLSEACELLLLQRWCRDLLLEEFVTTLHLVSDLALAVVNKQ